MPESFQDYLWSKSTSRAQGKNKSQEDIASMITSDTQKSSKRNRIFADKKFFLLKGTQIRVDDEQELLTEIIEAYGGKICSEIKDANHTIVLGSVKKFTKKDLKNCQSMMGNKLSRVLTSQWVVDSVFQGRTIYPEKNSSYIPHRNPSKRKSRFSRKG